MFEETSNITFKKAGLKRQNKLSSSAKKSRLFKCFYSLGFGLFFS